MEPHSFKLIGLHPYIIWSSETINYFGRNKMKMKLRPVIACNEKFKGYLPSRSWTLCLGAGISKGIVPDWQALAHNVVNNAFGTSLSAAEFEKLVYDTAWTLDSWIQAAANKYTALGKSSSDFQSLIEFELYSIVRTQARGMGLEKYLMQVLSAPKTAPKNRVIEVCDFLAACRT